jgi:ATP-binding cassette subfamily B protein
MRTDGAGRMMSRVLETETVEHLAIDAGGALLFTAIDLIFASVVLAFANGALAKLELAALAAFVVAGAVLGLRMYRRRSVWTDARLTLTHEMIERLVGHRTRLAQEPRRDWHEDEDQGSARAFTASKRLDAAVVALGAVLPRAWLVVSIAIVAVAILTGPRNPEGIPLTIGGILIAFRSLRRASAGANAVTSALLAWQRVAPLFHAAARVEAPPSPRVAIEREARDEARSASLIEARDVAFSYARRRGVVLDRVSFRIAPGARVLVTGPTGGGKSTFGTLLAGLRRPTSGLLLFDGLDATTMGISSWRRHVTSAPQFHENHVLGGTLAFNLLMGRAWPPEPADVEAAEEICRELDLGPLLERMPAGIMQTVGETGWQLSHGERSRVYLARALLQNADLVVLDESFAALDPATLRKAVECARRRAKTLVVIAHP